MLEEANQLYCGLTYCFWLENSDILHFSDFLKEKFFRFWFGNKQTQYLILKCFYCVKKQIICSMRNSNKNGSGIKSIGNSLMGLQKVAKHFKPIFCYSISPEQCISVLSSLVIWIEITIFRKKLIKTH